MERRAHQTGHKTPQHSGPTTLFMCGDVMTGRGIDQILPNPGDPTIHERYMTDAKGYVAIAERVNGPIHKPVKFPYIWGDALLELEMRAPHLRLINLETAITRVDDYWKGKGINYRMHPKNIPSITASKVDYCSLANNHILDWGYSGLKETLEMLNKAKIKMAGAGRNIDEATKPAVLKVGVQRRVLIFSFGTLTSGIPWNWAASEDRPGVNLLKDLSVETIQKIKERVKKVKRQGNIVVASIHWGENWGFEIPHEQTSFAHIRIDV